MTRRRGAPRLEERMDVATVVACAARLVEADGVSGFSLRAVARTLGVQPSALYNHVADRDALLTAVVAHDLRTLSLPTWSPPWPDWLRAVAHQLHRWLLDRPQSAELVLARAHETDEGRQLLRDVTDQLQRAGLSPDAAHLAWHAVHTWVLGTTQQSLRQAAPAADGTSEAVLDLVLTGLRHADPVTGLAARHRPATGSSA